MFSFHWILLATVFASLTARADVVFPVNSLREQGDSDCWAYGSSMLTEARVQHRDGFSVALDLEKSLRFWQIHDRLVQEAATKTPSDDLLDPAGYAADYWDILVNHGFETFHVETQPSSTSFAYPTTVNFILQAPFYPDAYEDDTALSALEQTVLSSSENAVDAEKTIMTGLKSAFQVDLPTAATTSWPGGTLPVSEVGTRMLGPDLESSGEPYSRYSFVLLDSYYIANQPALDGKWLKYNDDRDWAIGMMDMQKMMSLARLSLDRGWPVTFETADHVMAALGYKTLPSGQFAYEVLDQGGAYFPFGVTWQAEADVLKVVLDITVFYPILRDQLPAPSAAGPLALEGGPQAQSIRIPRRR